MENNTRHLCNIFMRIMFYILAFVSDFFLLWLCFGASDLAGFLSSLCAIRIYLYIRAYTYVLLYLIFFCAGNRSRRNKAPVYVYNIARKMYAERC